MGFSTAAIAAYAGAAAAVGGAAYSYSAGQDAAAASKQAQNDAFANQNAQFQARAQAQQTALSQQTAIQSASRARFDQNQQDQQTAQVSAANDRRAALAAMNNNEQAISTQRDNAVTQATDATSAPALQDAQAAQVLQQQTTNAPVQQAITETNPLGTANTGATKQALDDRLAGAQKYVKNYGDTQAILSGYNAPIALAGRTATNLGANLMPAAAMDQIVKTGAPSLLAPSSAAYANAGQYGTAVQQSNGMTTQGAMDLSRAQETGAVDLANLTQTDKAAQIQSTLNGAQNDAAIKAALGNGLQAVGNAGIQYGATKGAFGATAKPAPKPAA